MKIIGQSHFYCGKIFGSRQSPRTAVQRQLLSPLSTKRSCAMGCTKLAENSVMLMPNEKIIVRLIWCLTYTSAEEISGKMSGMKTLTSHRHPGWTSVAGNANRFWPALKIRGQRNFQQIAGLENFPFFAWWARSQIVRKSHRTDSNSR